MVAGMVTGWRRALGAAGAAAFLGAGLAAMAFGAGAQAQVGHPAKGSWLGYWGPNEDDQRRLRLLLDWESQELSGVVNPGPSAVALRVAEIDYDTWTMTLEADMPVNDGGSDGDETAPWVAEGVIENLGSWRNRRYSGTYTHGGETGAFQLTLN
jgi:hypothetical protein